MVLKSKGVSCVEYAEGEGGELLFLEANTQKEKYAVSEVKVLPAQQ